jgi:NAD(P)-dependent dehydrogenase (short-subunit alcohol dehydrogenase family)
MNLFIVYGSESSLLNHLYQENNFYLRIYNNEIPKQIKLSVDLHYDNLAEIGQILRKIQKENLIDKVIFIGSAFQSENSLLINQTDETIESLIDVNIKSYLKVSRDIIKNIDISKEKIFVYLSSFRSNAPIPGTSIYSSSKAFGELLFKSMNQEYSRINLRSSVIRMGYFDGRMLLYFDETSQDKFRKKISLKRFGKGIDLVNCINYIVENPYTAGGVIDLTGGISSD